MNLPVNFKKDKLQVLILAILVSVIALILYLNLLLLPQIGRVIDVVGKANKTGIEVKSAQADAAKIGKLKSDINAYREKIDSYEKMLPAEQEIPSLLQDLSVMAKESNVRIIGIFPTVLAKDEKQAKTQVYQEIPILINAKSGYHELGRFLAKLENSSRFMKVADIGVKANRLTPRSHDVELLVVTYMLLQTKQ